MDRIKERCREKNPPAGCPPVPFGGPASGLWPLGSRAIGPAGIQPSSCLLPTIFSECFQGCDGAGNCGWTTLVGTVVFTGENVTLDPAAGAAVIFKNVADVPNRGTTTVIRFREMPGPTQPTMAYGLGRIDATGNGNGAVQLRGDGTAFVQLSATETFNGLWNPQPGAAHTVFLTVALDGTPTLFIDQVFIPLTPGGVLVPAPFGPAVAAAILNFGGTPAGPAILYSFFITKGIFPPTTVFCCPSGQPPA